MFLVKNMSEVTHLMQIPSPNMQSYEDCRTNHGRFQPLQKAMSITQSYYDILQSDKKSDLYLGT